MTVAEFYKNCKCRSKLKVKSAYNGKILCYDYNPKKHTEIGKRELCSVWADVQLSHCAGYGNYAQPIMCCFVDGMEEYQKEREG